MIVNIDKIKYRIENLKTSVYSEPVSQNTFVPAGVLIPIFEKDGNSHIIFTKRTDKVTHHKGQISFPGGKFDNTDEDLKFTALRETFEEIGVQPKDVSIIGKINNMITNTNFIISPYVGVIPYPYDFKINPFEITELICVPVYHLLDKANFRTQKREFNGHIIDIYYYDYKEHTIWGVTGKILFDFIALLEE